MGPHAERRSEHVGARSRVRCGPMLARLARVALVMAILLAVAQGIGASPQGRPMVARCELTGTVDAGSAAYLQDCVERAEQEEHQAVLIRVDTPGGSLESTRQLVGALLRSRVPVLIWVGPAGARAGSAGVFVTLAAHVAAMAPSTNIGAAHPVAGPTGADPEQVGGEHLAEKVVNDAVAFAQAIARQRGRNEEWAAQAVRESASVYAEQAVQLRVVDLIATSETDLLERVDGRTVTLSEGSQTLRTRGAELVSLSPTLGQRIVHALANPTIAYLLFLAGMLGLVIELSHPGGFAPGILGVTCLVLALVAFSALPIRTGAVVILACGVALLVAELFTSSGLLALSGTGLLALGGVLLIDRSRPGWLVDRSWGISLEVILPTVLLIGGAATYVVFKAAQTRRLPQRGGDAGLTDEVGRALSPLSTGGGEVFIHGERWRAVSERPIPAGAEVVVRRIDGLTLYVEEASHVRSGGGDGNPDPGGTSLHPLHLGGADRQRV